MTSGRLVAVVGPSGVGKDSVITALAEASPALRPVRRTITRAPGLGGEDYDAVSPDAFARALAAGRFCLHWQAHGLSYGIPSTVLEEVEAGATRLANLSRGVLVPAAALFPRLAVLHVTARPETLARRLAGRGRETEADIARRLSRAAEPLPPGLDVIELSNDGPLEQTVAAALAALQPVRA